MKLLYRSMALLLAFFITASTLAANENPVRLSSLLQNSTRVVLSCKNVVASMAWWTRLGFTPTADGMKRPDSAITLTDNQILLTLVKDSQPSPVLMFGVSNIRTVKDSLDSLRVPLKYDVEGPTLGEIRLQSPAGIFLAIRPSAQEPIIPVTGDSNSVCGRLTEFSVSTPSLQQELKFWDKLSFTPVRSSMQPYPFSLVSDGHFTIGIHESRDIPSVALTFFAADMADRIERLKKQGITCSEELKSDAGITEHAFLTSPDGQFVLLFTGNQ